MLKICPPTVFHNEMKVQIQCIEQIKDDKIKCNLYFYDERLMTNQLLIQKAEPGSIYLNIKEHSLSLVCSSRILLHDGPNLRYLQNDLIETSL